MSFLKFLSLGTIFVISANARFTKHDNAIEVYDHHHVHENGDICYAIPKYSYSYGVNDEHSGDQKEQHQVRDGDRVQGHYTLVEPDNSIRIVNYAADDANGFKVVNKIGRSKHLVRYNKKSNF